MSSSAIALSPARSAAPGRPAWPRSGSRCAPRAAPTRVSSGVSTKTGSHVDEGCGLLMVVDGLGGQAAGGKAADTALAVLRTRLERRAGPVAERIREAITIANNEIHWLAATRAEWHGMACVLTVAVIENGRAVIGHVGDTRLYKLRPDGPARSRKSRRTTRRLVSAKTPASSPKSDAMRHPRRNEVYRDVGSEPHNAHDPDFIDIYDDSGRADAALLICSDGLTDMREPGRHRSDRRPGCRGPRHVVQGSSTPRTPPGGKTTSAVVYVEREHFAPRQVRGPEPGGAWFRDLLAGTILMALAVMVVMMRASPSRPMVASKDLATGDASAPMASWSSGRAIHCRRHCARGRGGTDVIVEPGEYRERLTLRTASGSSVVSRARRRSGCRAAPPKAKRPWWPSVDDC